MKRTFTNPGHAADTEKHAADLALRAKSPTVLHPSTPTAKITPSIVTKYARNKSFHQLQQLLLAEAEAQEKKGAHSSSIDIEQGPK